MTPDANEVPAATKDKPEDDTASMKSDMDEDDDVLSPDAMPHLPSSHANRGRRASVSAESMDPTADVDFKKIVIPKTDEQKERIAASVKTNFLFRNLEEEQYRDVLDAMWEKKYPAGTTVIEQGGVGDYFYVVEIGDLDVFVAKNKQPPVKVTHYSRGGAFGELALMYNAPRAATVKTTSDSTLWALDRVTFRRILMDNTFRKRKMYELFLEEVPLLVSLEPYERFKIADALESITFNNGEVVIKQGNLGDAFYIIESGEASVERVDEQGVLEKFPSLKKGDYFGELALLTNNPRQATVTALGKLKCATLGKKAFDRLLGPVVDIIKRNTQNYHNLRNLQILKDIK